MNANLMDAVSGHISPDLVQKAAAASGESNEGTRTALLGAVPTLFAGLAHSASTPSGDVGSPRLSSPELRRSQKRLAGRVCSRTSSDPAATG